MDVACFMGFSCWVRVNFVHFFLIHVFFFGGGGGGAMLRLVLQGSIRLTRSTFFFWKSL